MFLISTDMDGWRSQGQPCLTGAVSDGGDPTVVLVATAVEDDGVNTGVLGPLGEQLTDALGLGGLVTVKAAQVGLHRRG